MTKWTPSYCTWISLKGETNGFIHKSADWRWISVQAEDFLYLATWRDTGRLVPIHTVSRKDTQPLRFCLSANCMWMNINNLQSKNGQVTAWPKTVYKWVPLLTIYDFQLILSLLCNLCGSYWYGTPSSTWFSLLSSNLPISHFSFDCLLTDSFSLTSASTI